MADSKYPNSGAMFARQKRSERAADFGGQFTIDEDVLDYVLRCAERGQKVELEISAWKRQTSNSGQMLGLKIELPLSERNPSRNTQSRPGGSYRSGGGEQSRYQSRDQGNYRGEQKQRDFRRDMNDDFPEEVRNGPRRSADKDPWD